jgi:hypothetical protein
MELMQTVLVSCTCRRLFSIGCAVIYGLSGLLEDSVFVSIEGQVAMFMHFVGQRWTNRNVGFEFMMSEETLSRYFHSVLYAICVLSGDLITTRFTETHPKILNSSRFNPYFEVI